MEMKPRLTSCVMVMDGNRFLLAERNKENYNGYWVFPGGGVKFGETTREAAVREIKEETGLDVEIIRQVGHKEIINVPANYHSVVFFYLAKPKHTTIKVSSTLDIAQAKFFTIEEIKRMKLAESAEWALKQAGFWE